MELNLLQAAEFMITNGYIIPEGKDKFRLTAKFSKHYKEQTREKPVTFGPMVPLVNWEEKYKQFIIDAQVPQRLEAKMGTYQANGYSEKGMKMFKEAIVAGRDYELMVRSTMLYYKSSLRYKVAIGRYMEEGIWKTHYDALKRSAEDGTIVKHIENELSSGETSAYSLG